MLVLVHGWQREACSSCTLLCVLVVGRRMIAGSAVRRLLPGPGPWAVRLRAAWKCDLYIDVVMVCVVRAEGTETGSCRGTQSQAWQPDCCGVVNAVEHRRRLFFAVGGA